MSHSCAGCWTMSFPSGPACRFAGSSPQGRTTRSSASARSGWCAARQDRRGPAAGVRLAARLAPLVPLEIPFRSPRAVRPTSTRGSGMFTWVEGTPTPIEDIDPTLAARDLAVRRRPAAGGSSGALGGGIPLAERDEEIRYWLARSRRRSRGGGVGARTRGAGVGGPAGLAPRRPRRSELARADGRICAVIDWEARASATRHAT